MSEDEKITVTWDDLNSRKVEARLDEQQAIERNRSYAQLNADAVGAAPTRSRAGYIYNTIVYMTVFGILGGLLAWGSGLALELKSPTREQSDQFIHDMQNVTATRDLGKITAAQAQDALAPIRAEAMQNPYFQIENDPALSDTQRKARLDDLSDRDRSREFIVNVLIFGISGMWIAACLAVAEPLVQRNITGAVTSGSIAALLGLVGGLASAVLVYLLRRYAGERHLPESAVQTASWGVLGLFLVAGAGLVMRNLKRLLIGVAGGALGGVIGGALFVPIRTLTESVQDSRLIALVAIGVVAGIGTGLIENAARTAWLRVIAGVLAGKQFVLYRNPTFIGSAPACQIYLFKDNKVGPRHAAIHILPGAIELEDLPLGQKTLVNQKPITRTRLRHGDRISVGSTVFLFQDRAH